MSYRYELFHWKRENDKHTALRISSKIPWKILIAAHSAEKGRYFSDLCFLFFGPYRILNYKLNSKLY